MRHLIGQSLNQYRLDILLNEGGMGAVFKALDLRLQRDVAIKVMQERLAQQTAFQDRFIEEARSIARLDHPGVVRIYDVGQAQLPDHPFIFYIVMEFVQGSNLSTMLHLLESRGQWVSLAESIELVRQVSLAVDYIHQAKILHRDIKPANILLKKEGASPIGNVLSYQPILTDLGLAHLIDEGGEQPESMSSGTPAYMAPEQALGQPTDERSDIYSLGILLYELATGRPPLPARTLAEAVYYHSEVAPAPPSEINPLVPQDVEAVILQCLCKDPAERIASAHQLADLLDGLPIEQYATSLPLGAITGKAGLVTQMADSYSAIRGQSLINEYPPLTASSFSSNLQLQILQPDGLYTLFSPHTATVTVGRGPDNALIIDDPKVSLNHLRIDINPSGLLIQDMGSENGVFLGQVRLLPGSTTVWPVDKLVRIGNHYMKQIVPKEEPPPHGGSGRHQSATSGSYVGDEFIRLYLQEQQWTVAPGETASIELMIINHGTSVERINLMQSGLPELWLSPLPPMRLMPGNQEDVTLTITPPRVPESIAQVYPFSISAFRKDAHDGGTTVAGTLTVTSFSDFDCQIYPQQIRADETFVVTVENQGNRGESFRIALQPLTGAIQCQPLRAEIDIPPGESSIVHFATERMERLPLVGETKNHLITVDVQSSTEKQNFRVSVRDRSLLSPWAGILLTLLFLSTLVLGALAIRAYWDEENRAARENNQKSTVMAETAIAQTATTIWNGEDDDVDGLSNGEEVELGTDPDQRDTDGDGLDDNREINDLKTDPRAIDTDNDNLSDSDELARGSDPTDKDSDGDDTIDGFDEDPLTPHTPTPNAEETAIALETAEAAGCIVTLPGAELLIRDGPGQAYGEQYILGNGRMIKPISYVANGNPDLEWIEVKIAGSNQTGWVHYNESWLECNLDVRALRTGIAPPLPTPTVTHTPSPTLSPTPTESPTATLEPIPTAP